MAKDNLFLGFGRGKIGDVVFYRRNGQQISRARNRSPRNPNTFRQQLQRAVSANVQRLYSAGMEVFNHSFEGRKVGEGNQQEFVRQNMNLLRNLLVADYNLGRADDECLGRFGAPGLTIPVPFDGMCISNGSIQQQLFSWDQTDGFSMPDPLRDQQDAISETVGAYARRVGLVPDDIYTFVAFGCDPLEGSELAYFGDLETFNNYAAVFSQLFGYAQLRVLPGVLDDDTAITSSTTLASFFTPAERGTDISGINLVSPITTQIIDERMVDGMIGCIRSREDSGVRSPSFMHVQRGLYDYGLTVNYLSAAWSRSAGIAGSDLLLEGSEFAPSGGGGDAVTTLYSRSDGTNTFMVDNFGRCVCEDSSNSYAWKVGSGGTEISVRDTLHGPVAWGISSLVLSGSEQITVGSTTVTTDGGLGQVSPALTAYTE